MLLVCKVKKLSFRPRAQAELIQAKAAIIAAKPVSKRLDDLRKIHARLARKLERLGSDVAQAQAAREKGARAVALVEAQIGNRRARAASRHHGHVP